MKKQSQLLRQSRFQLHRHRLATSWKHVALYTGVRHYVYTHRVSHTSLPRNRRVNLDVGDASRHGMRRREHITNVSLLPSFVSCSSFSLSFFVRHRSLALERHHILIRRFYLRGNSKGDGQLCHRRCSLTGRRRDATTWRLKPWLRRFEFILCIPFLPSRSSRTKTVSRFSFFQFPESRIPSRLFVWEISHWIMISSLKSIIKEIFI